MEKKTVQSIEPNIADLANGWLKTYKLNYKLEQESLNSEIDKALADYFTKNGGVGANRPDVKLLLQDKNLNFYPVLIEYKGYKDKLVKLDATGQVENKTAVPIESITYRGNNDQWYRDRDFDFMKEDLTPITNEEYQRIVDTYPRMTMSDCNARALPEI